MKLLAPFIIGSRLAPCLPIGDSKGALSFVDGLFVINLPDGTEHVIKDYRAPLMGTVGDTEESKLQDSFGAILAFMSACAESRAYSERQGYAANEGENADMFPEHVGAWLQSVSDELGMLQCELDEREGLIQRD